MKRINIDGIVGQDVRAAEIRAQLDQAGSEHVELLISSPGGSVFEGISIYNAIRDHRREGGRVSARVVGLAGSMATYIPIAAETIDVEDNSVFMIHNPSMLAIGDQRDMEKSRDTLEGIAKLLASAYARKTGKPVPTVRRMMDEETYLFAAEIVREGFADRLIESDEPETREQAFARARQEIQVMESRLSGSPRRELGGIAALLRDSEATTDDPLAMIRENVARRKRREAALRGEIEADPETWRSMTDDERVRASVARVLVISGYEGGGYAGG